MKNSISDFTGDTGSLNESWKCITDQIASLAVTEFPVKKMRIEQTEYFVFLVEDPEDTNVYQ